MKTGLFYRSLATIGAVCVSITAATLDNAYRAEIDQWRQQREAALRADG
jgi:hypothetical protein